MTRIRCIVTYLAMVGCLSGCALQAAFHPSTEDVSQSTQNDAPSVQQAALPPPATPPAMPSVPAAKKSLPADANQGSQVSKINPESPRPEDPSLQSQKPHAAMASAVTTDDPLVKSTCKKIANKLASVTYETCWGLRLSQTGRYSVNGVPILQKIFPPKSGIIPLGRVTLIGGTHGNELSSISIVFKWLEKLQRHHSGAFHWTVVPLLNPDGALRKTSTRGNGNGVDLNRNLPTPGWKQKSKAYWNQQTKRNYRYFPGLFPASEPESKWLTQHIEEFQPDIIISVHSPHNLVDYDAPDRRLAPQRIGMLHRHFLGIYPGSLGNYAGLHKGIPVITLELPHSWTLPTSKQISHMWIDLVRWLKRNVPNVNKKKVAKLGNRPQSK